MAEIAITVVAGVVLYGTICVNLSSLSRSPVDTKTTIIKGDIKKKKIIYENEFDETYAHPVNNDCEFEFIGSFVQVDDKTLLKQVMKHIKIK